MSPHLPRLSVIAVVVLATAALTLSGCGPGTRTPKGAASHSPSSYSASASASPSPTVSASPVQTNPADPRGYTDADIVQSVNATQPTAYGDYSWLGYTPDLPGTERGVGYKFGPCQKSPSEVFNNITFNVIIGTANGGNGSFQATTSSGGGYIPITGDGPEGTAHFQVDAESPGMCPFTLDFVSKGGNGNPNANLGTLLKTWSGSGSDNLDTPDLQVPWHVAWSFTCTDSTAFAVADSGMDGHDIVDQHQASNSGVFDQYGSDQHGARTLMVVAGEDCNWTLKLYEGGS
jgi:hypothetical protein